MRKLKMLLIMGALAVGCRGSSGGTDDMNRLPIGDGTEVPITTEPIQCDQINLEAVPKRDLKRLNPEEQAEMVANIERLYGECKEAAAANPGVCNNTIPLCRPDCCNWITCALPGGNNCCQSKCGHGTAVTCHLGTCCEDYKPGTAPQLGVYCK